MKLVVNPFEMFRNWALVTAKVENKHNSMVIGWGTLGVLWRKDVLIVFVREDRYTYEFIEKADSFTVSFYDDTYNDQLKIYGTFSGRDFDKDQSAGFHPINILNTVTYEEAKMTVVCKKIFQTRLNDEDFKDQVVTDFYKKIDKNIRHHMYVGEIIEIIEK